MAGWQELHITEDGVLVEYRTQGDNTERRERKLSAEEAAERYVVSRANGSRARDSEPVGDGPAELGAHHDRMLEHFKERGRR